MKYYVISDIHSHYSSMITALEKYGFDSLNDQHHLIVLGDLFDRGTQAVEVLEYIYGLSRMNKASVLLGNHDSFLLDFLEKKYDRVNFNIERNGFGKTLEQLSGIEVNELAFDQINAEIGNRFPYLYEWLRKLPYYIKLDNYIFVHGGIDGSNVEWETSTTRHDFVWNREINLPRVPNKIVVAGHHRVATIRVKSDDYNSLFQSNPEFFDILYVDGKILIDRYVEFSNEINVLIIEM